MEEGLITRLLADQDVMTLVGERVYPGMRPQASELPAITLRRISGAPVYVDTGETGLATARVEVNAWGRTYTSAKLTARAVADSLSAFVGTVGGFTFQFVLLDAERDFQETGNNATDYPFRTNLDLIVWFEN